MKRDLIILAFLAAGASAQERPSIHQTESEYFRANPRAAAPAPLAKGVRRADLEQAKIMNSVVYGFHPYWKNNSEANYYFSLLTHIAYFSGDIDPTTGGFTTTNSWSSAAVVDIAQQYGVKVHFSVTLFSNHSALLGNSTNRSNLIANILAQIALRNADGCNVDFEAVSNANAANFRTFIFDLGTALKSEGKELVVELPAVDWSSVYTSTFFSTNNSVVDFYFLMVYDYYWSGSTTAGPVAPLTTGTSIRHVTRSINAYLDSGTPASKLIAGFPYYGYEWPVVNNLRMAAVNTSHFGGKGMSRTYSALRGVLPGISATDKFFDGAYNVPWYRYDSTGAGLWKQGWHDDSLSLAMKYDSVKARGIAGTGMWALGYDGTYTELWGALKNAFATTPNPAHTLLDSFEAGVGHFDKSPTFSGSTVGVSTSSTAALTNDAAFTGPNALAVVLIDNTTVTTNWAVRLLSGGGSVASNVTLSDGGYIGFWMRTSSAPAGAQVGLLVDDVAGGTERSPMLNVTSDGAWHLYEFNSNGAGWASFASGNGSVDGPTFTLDALYFTVPNQANDWSFQIDDVSYNQAGPLPVQLASFVADVAEASVQLRWRTQSERDNYGFEVERKSVSNLELPIANWETLGFLSGGGTTASPRTYAFTDNVPSPGRYAYRLRQVNRDGSYEYSGELEVEVSQVPGEIAIVRAFPNPFNPQTTVEFRSPVSGAGAVRVYDVLGREVALIFAGEIVAGRLVQRVFDGTGLTSGMYIIRFETSAHIASTRVMLMR